ncbi:hypothetical protein NCCP2140_08260 [Pseudoalteromonas sp. NCCP-2140]|uniref:hypothetical protein n=1 Tax=Pseudoalteromonas sp. NCCP-2140 TaxID=2942288 RepID=UPI00203BCD64|nr:hypothetical protein [Pseudoalteromonas sp. NCCP-2140]GKW51773.1 hypothetical protein NCCP2140_08260 [Pseudoalteromonas sp. NCCP-2140]
MNSGLKRCYEAFERLKQGNANIEEFKNLPKAKITKSIVSQEAGFDAGYLKSNREQHQPLISMINIFVEDNQKTTMGKGAAIKREKEKSAKARAREKELQVKLEAALGRELQLYHRLKEIEEELEELKRKIKSDNISHLQI